MYSCPCAYLIKHHAMKAYEEVEGIAPPFLILALYRGECSALHPTRFNPIERRLGRSQSLSGRCEVQKTLCTKSERIWNW
jgi:hypothetical protein